MPFYQLRNTRQCARTVSRNIVLEHPHKGAFFEAPFFVEARMQNKAK